MEMPLQVRRLPISKVNALVDANALPPGVSVFNPSYDGGVISVRLVEPASPTQASVSGVLLIREKEREAFRVKGTGDGLQPSIQYYQGLEDMRVCWYEGRLWFAGTSTHASHHYINDLVVGYFSKDLRSVEWATPVDLGTRPVKNVCPFVKEGRLRLLDMLQRRVYTVVGTEKERHRYTVEVDKELVLGPGIADIPYRGSTSPFHLHGNTWGFLAHDTIQVHPRGEVVTPLAYLHHYGEVDMSTGMITFMSSPFFLLHWGTEFVSGVQYDAAEAGAVRLFLGVKDKEALVCVTTLDALRVGRQ